MKKMVKFLLAITCIVTLAFQATFATAFIPGGTAAGWGTGAAFDNTAVEGINGFQFMGPSENAMAGTIYGTPCMQLMCNGAYITFNTYQATTLGFAVDQAGFDQNRTYSVDVYVNGVFQSSYNDFDSVLSNECTYYIFPGQNAQVMFVANSTVLNANGYNYFEPIYITKVALS